MQQLADAQALYVSESIEYTNETGTRLEYIMLNIYANCFRRETTLPYDNAALVSAFPNGYAPSGIEISSVKVNGVLTRWAMLSGSECFMRISHPLEILESCQIEIVYTLLLSDNCAFLGSGASDWRLTQFCPIVCAYQNGEWVLNSPSRAADWYLTEKANWTLALKLENGYEAVSGGSTLVLDSANVIVTLNAASEPALVLSRTLHNEKSAAVSVYGTDRLLNSKLLKRAQTALKDYSEMLSAEPEHRLSVVVSQCAQSIVKPGLIILSKDDIGKLEYYIAREYFGCSVLTNPCEDPFLIDGLSKYLSLLLIKHENGDEAFSKALNSELLDALKFTLPGSLTPDSQLSRFTTRADYDTVVVKRGAAVLHEIYSAFGEELFLDALRIYYSKRDNGICGIRDFVESFEEAGAPDAGNALIAWLYTIDEYANETLDFYY